MILAVVDNNESNFGIKLNDTTQLELVKKLAIAGLRTWYEAGYDRKIEANEYFDAETIENFYGSGYAEPTDELLTRYGIPHEIVDLEYDKNGEPICDECIVY